MTANMISMKTNYVASYLLIFTAHKTIFSYEFYLIYAKLYPFNFMKTL